MLKRIVLAAVAAGALVAPVGAQTRPSQIVSARGLDLGRAADVVKLERRIARAARAVCGSAPDWDLKGQIAADRCRTATIVATTAQRDRLVAAARAPALAAAR